MSDLPPGWQIATLDELQASEPRAITDGPFGSNLASAHYTSDGARVVRLQNIGDGIFNDARAYISMQHFERLRNHNVAAGDLLIASLGEELPRACIAPASLSTAIVKADCIRVRLGERADPRWVMYAMQTPAVHSWAKNHLHGVTYRHILEALARQPGTLGVIFRKAQNRIQDPAKLKQLIADLINKENWSASGTDLKGDAYESLLAKGAEDIKSGAGQYFTPRPLIQAMVDCVRPTASDTVIDPAAGTGGFLLAAHEYAAAQAEDLTPYERDHLRDGLVHGVELVDGTARLAAMNLILHGIGKPNGDSLIEVKDALLAAPKKRYSVVLSNPPFGRKSSLTMVGADGREAREDREIERQDFVVPTSNKQLNFVQHIATILGINGRAAVVLPDNVLFEGGAGETIRRRLLDDFDVHTLLRLPTGIFYAQGVKANVLFFDKRPAAEHPWTERLWVYDFRTNMHFTRKQNPLRREHLQDFVDCYLAGKPRSERVETDRFKAFTHGELIARDKANLDITWLRDESLEDLDNLPAPEVIAREIVEDLTAALAEFEAVAAALEAATQPTPSRPRCGSE